MHSLPYRNKKFPCKKETDSKEIDESAANSGNFAAIAKINSEFRPHFFTTSDKNNLDDNVDDMDYDGFLNYRYISQNSQYKDVSGK